MRLLRLSSLLLKAESSGIKVNQSNAIEEYSKSNKYKCSNGNNERKQQGAAFFHFSFAFCFLVRK